MALLKKPITGATAAPANTPSPTAPAASAFESEPADETGEVGSDPAFDTNQSVAETKPAASTAVAVKPAAGGAVSTRITTRNPGVLTPLKDAVPVDYNTLPSLQINQGNWLLKEGKKMLGDTVDFELLSYQDQWVIQPGLDGKEGVELLRFSNDGITTTQGEDCREYLASLLADGYLKAAMKHRTVLVLNLLACNKKGNEALLETLYQVDLPPTSKAAFDAHRIQVDFSVSRGKQPADRAALMESSVRVVEKGSNSWSIASFTFSKHGL